VGRCVDDGSPDVGVAAAGTATHLHDGHGVDDALGGVQVPVAQGGADGAAHFAQAGVLRSQSGDGGLLLDDQGVAVGELAVVLELLTVDDQLSGQIVAQDETAAVEPVELGGPCDALGEGLGALLEVGLVPSLLGDVAVLRRQVDLKGNRGEVGLDAHHHGAVKSFEGLGRCAGGEWTLANASGQRRTVVR
jgi:hypothetical protein